MLQDELGLEAKFQVDGHRYLSPDRHSSRNRDREALPEGCCWLAVNGEFDRDDDDDYPYTPRGSSYGNDYGKPRYPERSDYGQPQPRYDERRYDERQTYGSPPPRYERNDRYDDQYDEWEEDRPSPRSRRPSPEPRRSPPKDSESYYTRDRSRRIPKENQWDEEDDDWF